MFINKYISNSGYCSRRQADSLVRAKKVKINGKVAIPTDTVNPTDTVTVEGKLIEPVKDKIYLIFNKPVGVITTTDENSPNNIIEYIKYPQRIFPVGRLDVNTSGLIILTNDGDIVNKILKGKGKIEKEYLAEVNKPLREGFLNHLREGIILNQFRTLPAKINEIDDQKFSITIYEGKNRQVRRMCEAFGYQVAKLKRVRIGNIELNDLKEGAYIKMDEKELKKRLNIDPKDY